MGLKGLRGLWGLRGLKGLIRKILIGVIIFECNFGFGNEFLIWGGLKTGIAFENIDEQLFAQKDKYICSLLEWEQNPQFLLGANLKFNHSDLYINSNIDFIIPLVSGKMYDSDFDEIQKIIYSIHETNYKYNIFSDLEIYNYFKINNSFSLAPVFNLSFSYFEICAKNGYGWTGKNKDTINNSNVSWDDSKADFKEQGTLSGIDINTLIATTFLGLKFNYFVNKKLNLILSAYLSPFSYLSYTDIHKDDFSQNRGYSKSHTTYAQYIDFFNDYKLQLEAIYKLSEKQKLSFVINFYSNTNNKQETYIKGYLDSMNTIDDYMKLGQNTNINYYSLKFLINYEFNLK